MDNATEETVVKNVSLLRRYDPCFALLEKITRSNISLHFIELSYHLEHDVLLGSQWIFTANEFLKNCLPTKLLFQSTPINVFIQRFNCRTIFEELLCPERKAYYKELNDNASCLSL